MKPLRKQSVALLGNNALHAATKDDSWLDDEAIAKIETTAGRGSRSRDERVTNRMEFRTLWLYRAKRAEGGRRSFSARR